MRLPRCILRSGQRKGFYLYQTEQTSIFRSRILRLRFLRVTSAMAALTSMARGEDGSGTE